MIAGTKRPIRQARAIPIRGRRVPRVPWSRTPFAALALSLLALLAPELTLAPTIAGERGTAQTASSAGPLQPARELPVRVVPLAVDDGLLAGIAVPARAVPAPRSAPIAAQAIDARRWSRALDAARAEGEAYGVAFAAIRDGGLLWSGASGRARDNRAPLMADTPMVIGSVTKTFVAATVLQLVEEGRLELDDAVRDHLPELRSISGEITLRQLLDHTSGLADLFNDETRRGLEEHPGRAWTADEILATLHEPWYEPGEGWAYANTNYYLLGMVVERVTGRSLAEELGDRFLSPLGLETTRVLTGTDGDPLEPAWTTIFWASGAMASSAEDLARWGDALYGGSEILSPASRRAMREVRNDHDYGLGLQRIEIGKLKGIGHTGLLNTYTTLLFHVPDRNVTIALLVNRSHVDLAAMLRARPDTGEPSLLDLVPDR